MYILIKVLWINYFIHAQNKTTTDDNFPVFLLTIIRALTKCFVLYYSIINTKKTWLVDFDLIINRKKSLIFKPKLNQLISIQQCQTTSVTRPKQSLKMPRFIF